MRRCVIPGKSRHDPDARGKRLGRHSRRTHGHGSLDLRNAGPDLAPGWLAPVTRFIALYSLALLAAMIVGAAIAQIHNLLIAAS